MITVYRNDVIGINGEISILIMPVRPRIRGRIIIWIATTEKSNPTIFRINIIWCLKKIIPTRTSGDRSAICFVNGLALLLGFRSLIKINFVCFCNIVIRIRNGNGFISPYIHSVIHTSDNRVTAIIYKCYICSLVKREFCIWTIGSEHVYCRFRYSYASYSNCYF